MNFQKSSNEDLKGMLEMCKTEAAKWSRLTAFIQREIKRRKKAARVAQ